MLATSRLPRLHPLVILGYTAGVLVADARLSSALAHWGLAASTLALLWIGGRALPSRTRLALWVCVPVSLGFEAIGSLVWGGYTYRDGGIPAYVPPGHALVLLFGLAAASLPLVRRHRRGLSLTVLALASSWTLGGLTLLPLLTGRIDLSGAVVFPLLAWALVRSEKRDVFAAIWICTTVIELVGTAVGDWAWAATAPWTSLESANPPSGVAGGYAVIDAAVLLVTPLVAAVPARVRTAATAVRTAWAERYGCRIPRATNAPRTVFASEAP